MFKEDYTDFELSKKLKEIGFPQWNDNPEEYHPYVEGYDYDGHDTNIFSSNRKLEYSKVPLSLIQKWLREIPKYFINVSIYVTGYEYETGRPRDLEWLFRYNIFASGEIIAEAVGFKTYEQALSGGIDKCIELLKEKKL